MTLEFIKKRIVEQQEYLANVRTWYIRSIITEDRYKELYDSAKSQLDYFENKKKEVMNVVTISE